MRPQRGGRRHGWIGQSFRLAAVRVDGCLITGCGGFMGSHLAEFLLDQGKAVSGLVHRDTRNIDHLRRRLRLFSCDLLDSAFLAEVLADVKPDIIFHLAAQSLPVLSWKDPGATFRVNVLGTLALLEAVRQTKANTRLVIAGSSAEYGCVREDEVPIKEEQALRPSSPYAVSKMAQELLAHLYGQAHGIEVVRVRPFLIVGPRKVGDAFSDFARGIAEIEQGTRDVLLVGNLEVVRDPADVRDAVKAMALVGEKAPAGEVYNICSGRGYRLADILDLLVSLAHKQIEVRRDPQRLRPLDEPILVGDNSKVRRLGWAPCIPLRDTLSTILESWRQVLARA